MTEERNWTEKVSNWFFGIPAVAQAWAWLKAKSSDTFKDQDDAVPFHELKKPLAKSAFALVTTGGVHLRDQPPFDMDDPDGDPSYREIPAATEPADLTITHKYYDHRDADRDLNIVFPLAHFENLAEQGVIGDVAERHYAFMGHIDGPLVSDLVEKTAPEVAGKLAEDGIDCVLLTPA